MHEGLNINQGFVILQDSNLHGARSRSRAGGSICFRRAGGSTSAQAAPKRHSRRSMFAPKPYLRNIYPDDLQFLLNRGGPVTDIF